MSFANPWVFWLLLPLSVFLTAGGLLKRYSRPSLKYPVPAGVKAGFNPLAFAANWLGFSLICAALILCVIALARPRIEGAAIIPPNKGVDIILTIDISRSMEAVDFKPNRIEAAKATAEAFVNKRSSDRIGVIVFDNIALLQSPLTLDYTAVIDFIRMIYIGMTGGDGSTAIGDAVALSVNHLRNSIAQSKVIILLTDGENNAGVVDPMAAAKAAQSYGIKIHTIAVSAEGIVQRPVESFFGNVKYVGMEPISQEGVAMLMEMAKMTGGEFFRARNNLDLDSIYSRIDAMEKTEFDAMTLINYQDKYQRFLIAAIVLILLAFLVEKFIFIKIP